MDKNLKLSDLTPEQIAAVRLEHSEEKKENRRYETQLAGRWYYIQYSENPTRADQVFLTDVEMLVLGWKPEPEQPEPIMYRSWMDAYGNVVSEQTNKK